MSCVFELSDYAVRFLVRLLIKNRLGKSGGDRFGAITMKTFSRASRFSIAVFFASNLSFASQEETNLESEAIGGNQVEEFHRAKLLGVEPHLGFLEHFLVG